MRKNDGTVRVEHFATVYIKETKKQLSGSPASTFEYPNLGSIVA